MHGSQIGGFEDRYLVVRKDGKAIKPEARYIVMNYATDPYAREALKAYADALETDNPVMAEDVRNALENPEQFPSQHF